MMPSFAIAVAGALIIIGLSAFSAQADLYVLESTVPGIKAGARLADTEKLIIPAEKHMRAVMPSGKTDTFRGPYNGTVADLVKEHTQRAQSQGVHSWLRSMLETGGASEATPGASR